jgi:hypothetical protein
MKNWLKKTFIAAALLGAALGNVTTAPAATYFVRTDGNNGNSGTSDSAGGAWRTIDYAADHVSAGDVVRVQAGTYAEFVTPGVNGSSVNSMVTFVASGTVQMGGWALNNNSYIRIIGFLMDTTTGGGAIRNACVDVTGTCSYMEFWHNTMRNAVGNGIRCNIGGRFDKSLIIGNIISEIGATSDGSAMGITLRGDDDLVGYNEIYNSYPDGFGMYGDRVRYLGNYAHGLNETLGGHSDLFQTGSGYNPDGWEQNLIEGTFQVAVGNTGDEHTAQISYGQGTIQQAFTQNIFRRNVWHNVSTGTIGINQTSSGPITHTFIYNNTTAQANRNQPTTRYGYTIYGAGTSDTFIFNNLEYESWGSAATANLDVFYVTGRYMIDYNLAYDPNGPVAFAVPFSTQAHPRGNVNPQFIDFANDNFRLGANSGAINSGGPLTSVTSASGSGTTFAVSDAGFFRGDNTALSQYGGNLVVGDTITVGTDVVTVSSITGNNITVTTSFTWSQNDPVYFGNDTTPDIGAYPGNHVPLTSMAISTNGNTYTVTPNGDTRWVVFFQDGIPHAVDNSAPYTATISGATVTIRAYPLYASKQLSVTATLQGGGSDRPAPPANPRIVPTQ